MPKQEFDAAEPEEAEKVVGEAFVTDDQAAEVAEVGEKPLDLPTPSVTPELSAILSLGLFAVSAVGCDQLDALLGQLGI